jgi:hypothetical protein
MAVPAGQVALALPSSGADQEEMAAMLGRAVCSAPSMAVWAARAVKAVPAGSVPAVGQAEVLA